jgi:hypothetical protein
MRQVLQHALGADDKILRSLFLVVALIVGTPVSLLSLAMDQRPEKTAPATEPGLIPPWFPKNDSETKSLFQAWRNLQTPGAFLYWGTGWHVVAGVLHYEDGSPIANCPLSASYHDGLRGHCLWLTTDRNGYFIIYGVPDPVFARFGLAKRTQDIKNLTILEETRYLRFSAAPGYPFSWQGSKCASSKHGWQECRITVLADLPEAKFCVLSCKKENNFDAKEFEAFKQSQMSEYRKMKLTPWRMPLQSREGTRNRGIRNIYRVKVVEPNGKAIADALLHFSSYDGYEGNQQTVSTDAKGFATLEEEFLRNQEAAYYQGIQRELSVDIPRYGVGPISVADWKPNALNVITARPPAVIAGKVVDWNGNPIPASLHVEYRKPSNCCFELGIPVAPDGSFEFRRVLPDEDFSIIGGFGTCQFATPMGRITTEWTQLGEGKQKRNSLLYLPQASAISGIVMDEKSQPVSSIKDLMILWKNGGRGLGGDIPARFGMATDGTTAIQVRVEAKGFKQHLSNKISIAPGELRFVEIRLQRE